MTVQNIESGRTKRSYRLRDVLRALGLDDGASAELAAVSNDDLIRELGRRGWQTDGIVRGYQAERRKDDAAEPTSRSDNDPLSDEPAS